MGTPAPDFEFNKEGFKSTLNLLKEGQFGSIAVDLSVTTLDKTYENVKATVDEFLISHPDWQFKVMKSRLPGPKPDHEVEDQTYVASGIAPDLHPAIIVYRLPSKEEPK